MDRLIKFLLMVVLLFSVAGCAVQGARVTRFTFGTTFTVEDKPEENKAGDREYRIGFDDESNILNSLFGWLIAPKSENNAEG